MHFDLRPSLCPPDLCAEPGGPLRISARSFGGHRGERFRSRKQSIRSMRSGRACATSEHEPFARWSVQRLKSRPEVVVDRGVTLARDTGFRRGSQSSADGIPKRKERCL